MEYAIGVLLASVVGLFASVIGFDKERSFYPVVLIIIASTYLLFAAMANSADALIAEALPALIFVVAATLGFRKTPWIVVAGLALHGVYDFIHPAVITNPGVPTWWPGFCLAYDVIAAAYLAVLLLFKTRPMQFLELKVPPVPLAAVFAAAMFGLSLLAPGASVVFAGHTFIAIALALIGVAIAIAGILAFRAHSTTVNPLTPNASSVVVSSGVYSLSRNPMYLGFLLALAGWSVYLSNVLAALLLPAFVAYLIRFQIKPEERALLIKFGPSFAKYMAAVGRWL